MKNVFFLIEILREIGKLGDYYFLFLKMDRAKFSIFLSFDEKLFHFISKFLYLFEKSYDVSIYLFLMEN